ncbi:hypothetical protein [Cytophaga sp. FL35]|uniref:hypothetical protein n=1 Tax=Cytophaga sp. FL35 TaxID=1904456 RepID=UPI001653B41D|nr:hypothetical protein [Cytophaga sp. FL35]MBC6997702.1 hypothetical protein [Cytophaga sp. FL35]
MSKIIFLSIFFIFYGLYSQSQNIDGICSEADLFGIPVDNNQITYHKYAPVLQLKKRYASFEEVKNRTPEELLISQMSVQNNKWLAYNFENDIKWKEEQFKRITSQDPEKNYIELIRKITYQINGTNYSILRLKIYDDRKSKPATLSLMASCNKGKWAFVKNKTRSPLEFLMSNLNLQYLDKTLENEDSDNSRFNELIKSSWRSNRLSPTNIYRIIGDNMLVNDGTLDKVYERANPSSQQTEFQEYHENFVFTKNTINVNYLIPLTDQEFCYYFPNQLSQFDSKSIAQLIEYLENENINQEGKKPTIFPIHKFRYRQDNKVFVIVKYSIRLENEEAKIKTEVFDYNRGRYKVQNEINPVNSNLKYLLNVAKSDFIIQISNGENNADYPEVNALKPETKDANEILNLKELIQVITNNSSSLEKYLNN